MPSLVKEYFLQRPTVLSNDDFITFIHDRYFGDKGECARMPSEDFHAVHRTLNTLMKEPFLSTATDSMVGLIQDNIHDMFSFSADPAKQRHWERAGRAIPDGNIVDVDLFPMSMNYVGDIAGEILMGRALFKNYPNVLDDLWVFDNAFNALLTGAPPVTRRLSNARAARARLITAFTEWKVAMLKTFRGEDPGHKWRDMSDVSETMKTRVRTLEGLPTSDLHNAATNIAVYWGLMVNANKVSYWLLLHIISNQPLLAAIREEIAPFAKTSDSSDGKPPSLTLDAMGLFKSSPLFKASFYETMRLYTAGTSYKKVLEPLTLTESAADAELFGKPLPQSYHIPEGSFLVIPHSAMQTDHRLWADPERFDPMRFLIDGGEEKVGLDNDKKDRGAGEIYKISRDAKVDIKHLRPFGGGHTVCKGRTFAEREVLVFVAAWLAVWDFSPADPTGWKIPGKTYNGTGSASPTGQKVRVSVRRRA